MEIEWAAICENIERREGVVDLRGVLTSALAIRDPLPQAVSVLVAVLVQATQQETGTGSVLSITHAVADPDGRSAGGETSTHVWESGTDIAPGASRRGTFGIPIEIHVPREGLYTFAISLDGPPFIFQTMLVSAQSL